MLFPLFGAASDFHSFLACVSSFRVTRDELFVGHNALISFSRARAFDSLSNIVPSVDGLATRLCGSGRKKWILRSIEAHDLSSGARSASVTPFYLLAAGALRFPSWVHCLAKLAGPVELSASQLFCELFFIPFFAFLPRAVTVRIVLGTSIGRQCAQLALREAPFLSFGHRLVCFALRPQTLRTRAAFRLPFIDPLVQRLFLPIGRHAASNASPQLPLSY